MANKDEEERLTEADDIEVVEVDDAPGQESQPAAADASTVAGGDADDEVDDEEQEDTRLAERDEEDGQTDNQERQKRLNRRARQKAAKERLERRVEQLTRQVEQLSQGQTQLRTAHLDSTEAQIDSQIAKVREDIATADAIMVQAMKDSDGDSFVSAQTLRDQAKDRERELSATKTQIAESKKTTGSDDDGAVARFAQQWRSANPWYQGPRGSDNSSRVVNAIDAGLMAEGFDPKTQDYWTELTARTTEAFRKPRQQANGHDRQDPPRSERRAPPLGGSRESGEGGKRTVRLSRERVEAMKEAGLWDDPKLRAETIREYEKYDRENPASTR